MVISEHGAEPLRSDAATRSTGGLLAELDELVRRNRSAPDPELQRRLVSLRHEAFDELDRSPGRPSWPSAFDDPFPDVTGIPLATPSDLTGELLGGALVHHGCLRVDGLLSPSEASRFRAHIDRAFDDRDRVRRGEPSGSDVPWFVPFEPGQVKAQGFGSQGFVRTVDVPGALDELAAVFVDTGVRGAVSEYFNERPVMIANKWVLRRTPNGKVGTDFHQDGAFLGEAIRTVDCWISLSHCGPGTGRPAMDLVPKRFDAILGTGGDAAFGWSVTEETVRAAAAGAPVLSPVFAPGDALFFDEMLPHRTSVGLDMTVRHAIESWFVAPSSYPPKHVPVVL